MDSLTINMIFGDQYTKVQNCEYVPLGQKYNIEKQNNKNGYLVLHYSVDIYYYNII